MLRRFGLVWCSTCTGVQSLHASLPTTSLCARPLTGCTALPSSAFCAQLSTQMRRQGKGAHGAASKWVIAWRSQRRKAHCSQGMDMHAEEGGEGSVLQPVNGWAHGGGRGRKHVVPTEYLCGCHVKLCQTTVRAHLYITNKTFPVTASNINWIVIYQVTGSSGDSCQIDACSRPARSAVQRRDSLLCPSWWGLQWVVYVVANVFRSMHLLMIPNVKMFVEALTWGTGTWTLWLQQKRMAVGV